MRDILQADPVRHLETMAMTVPAASLEHQPFGEGEQDKNVVRSDEPTTKSAPATAEYTPSWFNIGRERGIASWGGVAQRSASTHPRKWTSGISTGHDSLGVQRRFACGSRGTRESDESSALYRLPGTSRVCARTARAALYRRPSVARHFRHIPRRRKRR